MSRLTINSNIASLNAQRNFTTATKKLFESYTRLSSGLRINRAVDDAAGLSISESLKADTRLFQQGVRNLNDGVSLLNIADSALSELSGIAIRLNELAEQSANGTLGGRQRLALDQEAQSLAKEYNRIARTTEFNGINLFDGDFGTLNLAAGGSRDSLIESGLGGGIGDGTFLGLASFASGSGTTAAVIADFNNDGIEDIVSTNAISDSVSIFIGNGNGTHQSAITFASPVDSYSIVAVDFNNDGELDLGVIGLTSEISIYLGNGDGSFSSSASYASRGTNLKIEDVNSDGVIDIITSNYHGGSIDILLGNANGSFRARNSIVIGSDLHGLDLSDLNNDGKIDIATSDVSGNLFTILGNGNGSFKTRTSISVGVNAYSVRAVDLNGDSNIDIINVDGTANTFSVHLGLGDGSFNSRSTYVTGGTPNSINAFDADGDGVLDVVLGNFVSQTTNVYLGNVNGTFNAASSYSGGAVVAIGDLNEDGAVDIITANYAAGRLGLLLGNSNDGVSALQSFSLKTQYSSKNSMSYLKETLGTISKQRGIIGAFQSRVETAVNNLQQASQAYSEANSRITDADIAEESAKLTANQIIQQAAASVLGQANLQPRLVLQLLEGI